MKYQSDTDRSGLGYVDVLLLIQCTLPLLLRVLAEAAHISTISSR